MKRKHFPALLLALILVLGLCPMPAAAEEVHTVIVDPQPGAEYNGYIVKLRSDAVNTLAEGSGAVGLGLGMYRVTELRDALHLAEEGMVEFIEPNYRLRLFDAVDEPAYQNGKLWHLNGQHGLNAPYAWEAGLDGSGVTVAVLDTGLYADNPDFANTTILDGYNAPAVLAYLLATDDDPGNDEFYGDPADYGDLDDYSDVAWHGTAVSGVIAAGINDYGCVGAAYGVNLLPIRVFDHEGAGYIDYLTMGIALAIASGADVINMSLGTEGYSETLEHAVNSAREAGVIVVAAAGNDGDDPEKRAVPNYPAAFDSVIGVGATASNGVAASYSQKNDTVWVSAPGSAIYMTTSLNDTKTTDDQYHRIASGTSFATPCVAAVAALARQYAEAHDQSLTPAEFADLLRLTAIDKGTAGYDTSYGYGVVTLDKVLEGMEAQSVRYELHDGAWDGDAPETTYFPYAGTQVQLTDSIPAREGYFFGGWYADEACTQRVTGFVPSAGSGERAVHAGWVPDLTRPAAMTLNGYRADADSEGQTWTAYLPVGTDIPAAEEAEIDVTYVYTGSDYSLEHRAVQAGDGGWTVTVTQSDADGSYTHSYELTADNTTYHAPARVPGQSAEVSGAAVPMSLDAATAAVPYTADPSLWFADADEDETLTYLLPEDVPGLHLSGGSLCYTPPASAAETTVSFTVTATDGRFVSDGVTVRVAVGELPVSAPALAEPGGSYDVLAPAELTVDFAAYDNALQGLTADGETLTEETDYAVLTDGSASPTPMGVVLKTDFLNTLDNGDTAVTLRFARSLAGGETVEQRAVYTVSVSNSCVGSHDWDEGELTEEPGCTSSGRRRHTCTRCGAERMAEVPPTGHTYENGFCTACNAMMPLPPSIAKPVETVETRDGREITTVASPDGGVSITVKDAAGETVAQVELPADPGEGPRFRDVAEDAWYRDDVTRAAAYGLFRGVSDSEFDPASTMTRGMLVTVLYNLSGKPGFGTGAGVFADVTGGWYARAAEWGYAAGVTGGTGPLSFSPEQSITREQLVTMLYRFAGLFGAARGAHAEIGSFPDGGSLSDYARAAVEWAVAEGLLSGRAEGGVTHIAPQATATRAEAAALLLRFVAFLKKLH